MMRMLPFDFRDDPKTYEIHDQFMFGPSLLVSHGYPTNVLWRKFNAVRKCGKTRRFTCRPDLAGTIFGPPVLSRRPDHPRRGAHPKNPLFVRAGSILLMARRSSLSINPL